MPIDVGGYRLSNNLEDYFIPSPVTNGLFLYLNASDTSSYAGTGTTWFDLTANNRDFTLLNGTAFSSTVPKSFSFDGVNDYAMYSFYRSNSLSTKTVEVVYRSTGTEPVDQSIYAIMGGSSGTNNAQTEIFVDGLGTTLKTRTITNTAPEISYSVSLNTIYHVVYVEDFSTTTATLYVNGESAGTASLTGTVYQYDSGRTHIGVQKVGFSRYLRGNVYLAREYNRALTPAEVLQNYFSAIGQIGV